MRTRDISPAKGSAVWYLVGILSAVLGTSPFAGPEAKETSATTETLLRVYEVGKRVKDFPEGENLSTPESAYAAINRLLASGDQGGWRRLSSSKVQDRLPPSKAPRQPPSQQDAERWRNARILEVRVFQNRIASVHAELSRTSDTQTIDARSLEWEGDRWLNAGEDIFGSLEEAQEKFARICSREIQSEPLLWPRRGKTENPEACLDPYIRFLKTQGQDPKTLVLQALGQHKVVILGEIHHRPLYWAFNSSLVMDPAFAEAVGTIYMELPMNDQGLVDRFLDSPTADPQPILETLRDIFEMGWPDQPMLDFFLTVWMVNRDLPPAQRLRIVFVDMARPWKEITKRSDWNRYDVDRDRLMAENLGRDQTTHAQDPRHALFLVGFGHAMLNFHYVEGTPKRSAGWHLREKLGPASVFSVIPHGPVMTNVGGVSGRRCLGLFDSAFAALGNRPVAIPLDPGPFGEQPFDADPEVLVKSRYRDGYNAYLYLGPLEYEIFSPLIAGFYTADFAKEVDRRYRLMTGKGWADLFSRGEPTPDHMIGWMNDSWGKPREWRSRLGPMDAWWFGDDWQDQIRQEQQRRAFQDPAVIRRAATALLDAIRRADYSRDWLRDDAWQQFPSDACSYTVHSDSPGWVTWVCQTFRDNPIVSVSLDETLTCTRNSSLGGKTGLPTLGYRITLKNGKMLEGQLPFYYDPLEQTWCGLEGLDWHRKASEPK